MPYTETFREWFIEHDLGQELRSTINVGEDQFGVVYREALTLAKEFQDANPSFIGKEVVAFDQGDYARIELWQIVDGEPDDLRTIEVFFKENERDGRPEERDRS